MAHDFKRFPELTNSQMDFYYFESPHKQITEDFRAKVVKVKDGDTISVSCEFRDFVFPVRFFGTNAPEMSEGGKEAKSWLEDQILNEDVTIMIDRNIRVGKWGRLIGRVMHRGMDMGVMMMMLGLATSFEKRNEGKIPKLNKDLAIEQWF